MQHYEQNLAQTRQATLQSEGVETDYYWAILRVSNGKPVSQERLTEQVEGEVSLRCRDLLQ